MTDKLPVGLIGAGSMGANHAKVLARQLGHAVHVYDVDSARAERLATLHPSIIPSTLDALLDTCSAVVIATPPATHRSVALDAMIHGRRVLLEKPACSSRQECEDLVEALDGTGSEVFVGYVERWNPAFMTVCQMLSSDEDILSIEFNRSGPLASQVTAGVVLDLMVHDLDLTVAMCNPARFKNCSMNFLDRSALNGMDIAYAGFEAGDTVVRLKASRLSHVRVRELRVTTARREIVADLARQTVEATSLSDASFVASEPLTLREATIVERPFVTAIASPLEAQLQAFLADEPSAHLATLGDAIQVHSLIERMQARS